jgi:predicted PurR-regulated permease PerM
MPAMVRKPPLFYALASFVPIIACLYWGRVVLIPVALAILLTFLLNPVVSMLQRLGLGRTPPVILIVVLAFVILGGIGWAVTGFGSHGSTVAGLMSLPTKLHEIDPHVLPMEVR